MNTNKIEDWPSKEPRTDEKPNEVIVSSVSYEKPTKFILVNDDEISLPHYSSGIDLRGYLPLPKVITSTIRRDLIKNKYIQLSSSNAVPHWKAMKPFFDGLKFECIHYNKLKPKLGSYLRAVNMKDILAKHNKFVGEGRDVKEYVMEKYEIHVQHGKYWGGDNITPDSFEALQVFRYAKSNSEAEKLLRFRLSYRWPPT